LNFWKREHSNIIVPRPSRDNRDIWYQFHIGNRKACKRSRDDHLDSDDKDDNRIPTESEQLSRETRRIVSDLETLETAQMIKQHIEDMTSMRELCQKVIVGVETATRDDVADEEMVIMIVLDYCQNMEMPFFRKDQPGETYYYTPETINLLGIVDCNPKKDLQHAYAYSEEEGGKGGNNAAFLIIETSSMRTRVLRWQETETAKYSYGQLSWTEQEHLCLEAGTLSTRERIFFGGQFHIPGRRAHHECR
jgi:hypothetical protein